MTGNFGFLADRWPELAQLGADIEASLGSADCPGRAAAFADAAAREIARASAKNSVLPLTVEGLLRCLRGEAGTVPDAALARLAFRLGCWIARVWCGAERAWPEYREPGMLPEDGSQPDAPADGAPCDLSASDAPAAQSEDAPAGNQEDAPADNQEDMPAAQSEDAPADNHEDAPVLSREEVAHAGALAVQALPFTDEERLWLLRALVRLRMSALSTLNFSLRHNGQRCVREIVLFNGSDFALEGAQLRLSAEPAFCPEERRAVGSIGPGGTLAVGDLDIRPDAEWLAGLTEQTGAVLRGELWLRGDAVARCEVPLSVLAYDQWSGLSVVPESLAAFVMPNHPALTPVMARAAQLLGQWTGDPSLDAYQSGDAGRVLSQAAAVYGALQEKAIFYASPPASFAESGQRVRLADAVLEQKLGTCLDLTLLYASLLEAIGLNALLVIQDHHAYAGLWLEDATLPEMTADDASVLTKRLADGVNAIAVVECTAVVSGRSQPFDGARALAERHLLDPRTLEAIIDIKRARLSGVKPLPMRIRTEDGWRVDLPDADESVVTPAPTNDRVVLPVSETDETPSTRRLRWERKLLDLGLRNTLINLRASRTMVPILAASLDDLENALSDGQDFTIAPRPLDWRPEVEPGFATLHDLGGIAPVVQSEFQNHRLRSSLQDADLKRAVTELYRTARTAMEENGANTLYMALGLLRWYENPRSSKARYAPLILLPIEMVRRSASQGYAIRLRDEEPQINITLLEKLKQDFGIVIPALQELPRDDHGLDTRMVFTIVRKAVMSQKNWDVLESAWLGLFSFTQFVMWNDLHNRADDLSRNKLVRSLMDGRLAWDAREMAIGGKVREGGVYLPLPADASQLFAIEAACAGESFVLHGPPGTGKSQTITTMIANALAQGKTVLFVAEKMAALEVVQSRLEKIGIGAFCLEVHSNKAKKRDVLDQLRRAAEVTRTESPESFSARADQLRALRAELDGYAAALHETLPCGSTLWSLIDQYEAHRGAPDLPRAARIDVSALDAEAIAHQRQALERLVAAGRAIGHPHGHPLGRVQARAYSQQYRIAVPEQARACLAALERLEGEARSLAAALEQSADTLADLGRLDLLARELLTWADLPASWAREEPAFLAGIADLARRSQEIEARRASMAERWGEGFFALDGAALLGEYRLQNGRWALPRFFGMNALSRKLRPHAKVRLDAAALEGDLDALAALQRDQAALNDRVSQAKDALRAFERAGSWDWEAALAASQRAEASACALREATGSDAFLRGHAGRDASPARDYRAAWASYGEESARLDALLAVAPYDGPGWFAAEREQLDCLVRRTELLRDWIAWNNAAAEAEDLGLGAAVDAYREGMPHEDVSPAWRKAVSQLLAIRAIDASPALSQFSGAVFNEKLRQFRELDEEYARLTREEIFCRLAARIPNFTREAAQSSELGILQRAIRSGGRGLSLRQLFEQLPTMLPRLAPCMLMSPISAAQYLDPHREPFDIVVFDEASQVPTCKAVGALARGRNAVIVGDPNQMPPTSFFMANTLDEENLDTEDMESILDDCLALSMPQTHLLWHYRSRHESLIAFSNRQFYEGRLFTFPSVDERETRVRLVHVDGVFDRGRTRQNRAEAEAVVAELCRLCHDPHESGYSVGVVTFNIHQQNLIEDLFTEACRGDEELEAWAYSREEPIFIKNLENVQGDERDVILFSVGYGPDETGHVSMNFGPLNRDSGWRRLNVAVSRARCAMVVYATITPEQIDLDRTGAQGVAALKAFLTYAQSGSQEEAAAASDARPSGVAQAIADALRRAGYETELAVGHSEYRIDVGVIDPRRPGRYLLGILLDGPAYGSAKTTRDREIAQPAVLRGLGWQLTRVWCMDWWENSARETERILAECRRLEALPLEEEAPLPSDAPAGPDRSAPADVPAVPVPEAAPALPIYAPAQLPAMPCSAERFADPLVRPAIRGAIERILLQEAPISRSLLTRRALQAFGISRAGARIQAVLETVMADLPLTGTLQDGEIVLWRADQDPDAYALARACGEGDARRDIRDVPVQELANACCHVLSEQGSLPEDDLIREAAKLMGYPRLSANALAAFRAAAVYARDHGLIRDGALGTQTMTEEGRARVAAM